MWETGGACPGTAGGQLAWFGVVGVSNTLVDFAVFNLLARPPFVYPRLVANLCSTSVAMGWSFVLHDLLTFPGATDNPGLRAMRFAVVTLLSLYGVQSAVLHLAEHGWPHLTAAVVSRARRCPGLRGRSEEFLRRNSAKLVATVASLVWNFCWYKFYVYT